MDNFIEAFISIAFIAIAFISWIIRLVGQSREEEQANARKQRAGRPPARRPPVRPPASERSSSVHSEIDTFLKQTSATGGKPPAEHDDEVEFEIVPDEEVAARWPAAGQGRATREPVAEHRGLGEENAVPARENRSQWDQKYEGRREQFRASTTGRQLATRPLGAELRETIETAMTAAAIVEEQRDQAEQELTAARQEIRVLQDKASSAPKGMTGARTRDVAAMLRNPGTVRDAIVINEILRPPPGLNRR